MANRNIGGWRKIVVLGTIILCISAACVSSEGRDPLAGRPSWRESSGGGDTGNLASVASSTGNLASVDEFTYESDFRTAGGAIRNHVFAFRGVKAIGTSGKPIPDSIRVSEATGFENWPSVLHDFAALKTGDRLVVFLNAAEPGTPDVPTNIQYNLSVAGVSHADGTFTFLGPEAKRIHAELERLVTATKAADATQLLSDWIAEYQSKTPGRIIAALDQLSAPPDPISAWEAIPNHDRPLDPEETPPGPLKDLAGIRIVVNLADNQLDQNKRLVIWGPTGQTLSYLLTQSEVPGGLVNPKDSLTARIEDHSGNPVGNASLKISPLADSPGSVGLELTLSADGKLTGRWIDQQRLLASLKGFASLEGATGP